MYKVSRLHVIFAQIDMHWRWSCRSVQCSQESDRHPSALPRYCIRTGREQVCWGLLGIRLPHPRRRCPSPRHFGGHQDSWAWVSEWVSEWAWERQYDWMDLNGWVIDQESEREKERERGRRREGKRARERERERVIEGESALLVGQSCCWLVCGVDSARATSTSSRNVWENTHSPRLSPPVKHFTHAYI